jgi:hypothetical protein
MGTIKQMSKKKIRCFSVNEVMNMRGIKNKDLEMLANIFIEYDVHVFQPWYSKVTSGPTRRPGYYVTTNENFDRWISLNNTCAMVKGLPIAKVKYKEYPGDTSQFNDLLIFE